MILDLVPVAEASFSKHTLRNLVWLDVRGQLSPYPICGLLENLNSVLQSLTQILPHIQKL